MCAAVKVIHHVLFLWAFLQSALLFFWAFVKATLLRDSTRLAGQLSVHCVSYKSVMNMFSKNEVRGQQSKQFEIT